MGEPDISLAEALDERGWARVPGVLDPGSCAEVSAWFDQPERFRRHVDMARHNYGRGEYRYFSYPLPPRVEALRAAFYARLAPIANDWHARLGLPADFPVDHETYLAACHRAGQERPTPLLLRYGPGDHNALHRDLYGPLVFPLQVAILLDRPGRDFEGGEFVLTEQRARRQSLVEVVPLEQGDAVAFAVNLRPVPGRHGFRRAAMRHGVSRLRSGRRHALGLIFHDAA